MPAALSVATVGGAPVGTGIVIAAVFALIFTLAVTLSARERRRFTELLEYAADEDWHPVPDVTGLPPAVAEAALSKRSKLFRRFHTMPLWVSWHQWTEASQRETYNASTRDWESRTVSTTRNLTRYFMVLPGTFPDMAVERRTRPDPAGGSPFDRRFAVTPTEPVSQRLAQALLAQTVPPFSISGNVLTTRYDDRPTQANLIIRADEVKRLTLLLTPSRQNRG